MAFHAIAHARNVKAAREREEAKDKYMLHIGFQNASEETLRFPSIEAAYEYARKCISYEAVTHVILAAIYSPDQRYLYRAQWDDASKLAALETPL